MVSVKSTHECVFYLFRLCDTGECAAEFVANFTNNVKYSHL